MARAGSVCSGYEVDRVDRDRVRLRGHGRTVELSLEGGVP